MDYNLVTHLESCATIIKENADFVHLINYSHVPISILALLVGGYVYFKNPRDLLSRILMGISLAFSLWSFFDLIAWLSTDSRYIMFAWSMQGMINALLFLLCFYFVHVFITKRDLPSWYKLSLTLSILPVIILTPTHFNLTEFSVASCEATEGQYFLHYYYLYNLFLFLSALLLQIRGYWFASKASRAQILLLSIGIDSFLVSFFVTGYLASVLENFNLAIYGLFGMAFFMVFLSYLIVQYRTFNIRLLSVHALVTALVLLVGSELFFITSPVQFTLIALTVIFLLILGRALARSVEKELERNEELQRLTGELAVANQELRRLDTVKTEFLSIASHQLRTPLTAMKGYLSLLLEDSYGKISEEVKEILNKVFVVNTRLARLVEELLNVSRIDAGRVQYSFEKTRLEPVLKELEDAFSVGAQERGLKLAFRMPERPLPQLSLDIVKIREVISNLIDNSLKYTKQGSVTVSVRSDAGFVEVLVEDTGIGIAPTVLPNLFEKFVRSKETSKLEVSGTGLGLYVGKKFVEAHGGTIRAESAGLGKGSRFIIRLPVPVR